MSPTLSPQSVTRAIADALTSFWGEQLGGNATLADRVAPAAGAGWIATVSVTGAIRGIVKFWFESAAATAAVARMKKLPNPPATDAGQAGPDGVMAGLRECVTKAMSAVTAMSAGGAIFAAVEIVAGDAPSGHVSGDLTVDDLPPCPIVLAAELAAGDGVPPVGDARFEAVLDVELPLVVRFGRAIMPLRTLAELGPGSVVDMGRSPDDPVELLVGERLIARGEVVVVSGNYGVRITELASNRPGSAEAESRTS